MIGMKLRKLRAKQKTIPSQCDHNVIESDSNVALSITCTNERQMYTRERERVRYRER